MIQTLEQSEYPPDIQRLIDRIAPGWPPIVDVSPGWYPLPARLDVHLNAIAPGYALQQCKSKFGSLSFYASPSDDVGEYNEAIRAAEWESTEICEVCGALGAQYVLNLWDSVLRPEHHSATIGAPGGSAG